MAPAFDIHPLDATFGAIVTGLKLRELDDATWNDLHKTWLKYALLVFPTSFSNATSRSPSPSASVRSSSKWLPSAT